MRLPKLNTLDLSLVSWLITYRILHSKSFLPASAGVISLTSCNFVLESGHGVRAGPGQSSVDGDLLAAGLDGGAAAGQDRTMAGSIAC